MKLEYTPTLEDFKEAIAPSTAAAKGGVPAKKKPYFARGLFGWVLFLGLAIVLFCLMNMQQRAGSRASAQLAAAGIAVPQRSQINVWRILVPQIIPATFFTLFLLYGVTIFGRVRKKPANPPDREKRKGITKAATIVILVISLTPLVLLEEPFRIDVDAEQFPVGYATLFTWIGALLLILLLTRLATKNSLRNQWDANPSLRRAKAVEIDERGVRMIDDHSDFFFAWPMFENYRETTNIFCLTTDSRLFVYFPKRAFSSPAELDALCALLQNNIKTGQFLPRELRFPVVPLATPTAVKSA
jgi:hypothetical protein